MGFTPNAGHQTNYSILGAQTFGIKIQVGNYLGPVEDEYTTVGHPATIYGMSNPKMIIFGFTGYTTGPMAVATTQPPYVLQYDVSNETVRWISSTAAIAYTTFSTVVTFLCEPTTTFAATTRTVPYLAIGW